MKYIQLAGAAYILMAIITFGYAYNHAPQEYRVFGTEQTRQTTSPEKTVHAFWCSVLWPLYLSVIVQEKQQ